MLPLIRKNGTFIDHLNGWKDRTMHKSISSQKSLLRFSIELDKNKEIFLTISALQCNDKKNIHIYFINVYVCYNDEILKLKSVKV